MSRFVSKWQLCFLVLLCAAITIAFAHPAFAQANGGANKNFSCVAGHAAGPLYTSGLSCPTTMGFDHIFSYIVCNMEELSSNLMGNMFCGMITSLAPAVSALLVFAVVIFGISFTIGIVPATAREFQMFLIKVCFVWAFATQSDYLIGIGYAFFINGIRDGIAIALTNAQASLGGVDVPAPSSGSAVYAKIDSFVATLIHYATDYMGFSKTAPIDQADPNAACKNALFAVLAIMAVAFPPIFYLALAMLGKIILAFLRAIFGYIYALVGIAFLMTLAPFFLSFFLFRQTRSFFDKWIGYLASFALQIIILFAFLSFVISIDVSSITNSLTTIVVRNQQTLETTSFRAPWDYCTLCSFKAVDANGNNIIDSQAQNFLGSGKLICRRYQGTEAADGHVTFTKDAKGQYQEISGNGGGGYPMPITILESMGPDKKEKGALLTFMTAGLLSLVIFAYIVEALLGYVASLAQSLATGLGGYSAPQLGGGTNIAGRPTVSMPFEGNITDFSTGFNRGYHAPHTEGGNNSISATTRAFKSGAQGLVSGNYDPSRAKEDQEASGIKDRFIDWLVDPTKFKE